MLPKLMIFDMDGLIFNTERLFMNIRATVLEKYGYEHRLEDYVRTIGLAKSNLNKELLAVYGDAYPADKISNETRDLVLAHVEKYGPEIMPGIPELLEWLKERNITCCVASSSRHDHVAAYVEQGGLSDYFSFIIGGDQVEYSKPNPDIFLKALALGNARPEEAMVLEDSENGILAAYAANIPAICIPDLKYPSDDIIAKTAAVLSNAGECIPWLTLKSQEL